MIKNDQTIKIAQILVSSAAKTILVILAVYSTIFTLSYFRKKEIYNLVEEYSIYQFAGQMKYDKNRSYKDLGQKFPKNKREKFKDILNLPHKKIIKFKDNELKLVYYYPYEREIPSSQFYLSRNKTTFLSPDALDHISKIKSTYLAVGIYAVSTMKEPITIIGALLVFFIFLLTGYRHLPEKKLTSG